jgi:hypothetical protein
MKKEKHDMLVKEKEESEVKKRLREEKRQGLSRSLALERI